MARQFRPELGKDFSIQGKLMEHIREGLSVHEAVLDCDLQQQRNWNLFPFRSRPI